MTDTLPYDLSQDELLSFDPVWYLQHYGDVQASGMDPWDHYLRMGRAEGRQPGPVRALELDHMLWRGFEDIARPGLEALLRGDIPRERGAAGWALARWYKETGDIAQAFEAICAFHDLAPAQQPLQVPGPWLLGVQLAVMAGHPIDAARILEAGLARFGPQPDFDLARMLVHRAQGDDDSVLSSDLSVMYTAHGLVPVTLAEGPGNRFERLSAQGGVAPDVDPPLVSVIIPAYNAQNGLARALSGLVAQSWQALEILVVDDGSSDGTRALAEQWAAQDTRIKVIGLETNQGAYPARNAGYAAATGAFITVHDADDWSHPEKITAQVRRLIEDDSLQATVSHWVRVSDDLDMTRWRTEEAWIYRNVSSLMVRASVRDEIGFWDRVRVNADTEYYYRILAAFGAEAIAEVGAGVPLAFGLSAAQSLTGQSATHLRTQFGGVRRDYMDAALYWQAQATSRSDLYLPQHPKQRPFRMPKSIGVGDPEGPMTAFDVVSASDLFDAQWYRLNNTDVLLADVNPVRHYLEGGARENRDPGPQFSSGGYRRSQRLEEDINPLLHFETEGRQAGANPLPRFEGALSELEPDQARRLVFAHTSGKTLFGAERSLLSVVERMARRGQYPVVVLPALRNTIYLDALLEVTSAVEILPQMWRHGERAPLSGTVEAIRGLIRRYDAAEVHVNTLVLDAPLIAARAEGVKSAVHVRELPAEDVALCRQLGETPQRLRERLLAQADRFIANSQPVAAWLGAPERTLIRPNSVDEGLFSMGYQPQKTLRVALISSNIAKKGIADFLRVARIVGQVAPDIRFLVFGPASQDLHLLRPWPENVDFCGYAPTPEAALQTVDVVMSLSKFAESFGRTVMEAMAAGRPVICYDRGTPPTLVQQGRCGFVVPADDVEAAARAVLALGAAWGQRSRLSTQARLRARGLQDQAMRA